MRPMLSFWAVRGAYRAPEGDVLPAPGAPPAARPEPEPAGLASVYVVCDHCGCKLNRAGEIVKMGDEARRHNKHDEAIERVRAELAEANRKLADANAKVEELTRQHSPAVQAAYSRY